MRAFVFCFLMIAFINNLYGQHNPNPLSEQPQTDTVNVLADNFYNKLSPINYHMNNYRYIKHKARLTYNITYLVIWSLNLFVNDEAPEFTPIEPLTLQDEILSNVSSKIFKGDYDNVCRILKENINTLTNPKVSKSINYYYNVATFYKFIGDYNTALEICEKRIGIVEEKISQKILINEHQKFRHLARLYNLIGEIHHVGGNYPIALDFYTRAVSVCHKVNNSSDAKRILARLYNNIGNTHYGLGNYSSASTYYDEVYKMLGHTSGYKPEIAETHNNKGNVFYVLGDYQNALEFYRKALKISKANTRKKDPLKVQAYIGISNTYYALSRYQEAFLYQEKAIQILEKRYGKNHPYTGEAYSKNGAIYYSLKDYKKALECQEKALQILSNSPDDNHLQKALVFNNLAITKFVLGKYKEAKTLQQKALGIVEKISGNEHSETIDYMLNLAKMYKATGNLQSAGSLWQIIIPQTIKHQNSSYLFLPDDQRLTYLNTVQNIYTDFYSFALAYGQESTTRLAGDILLNTKSLALDYSISFREIIAQIDDNELTELSRGLHSTNRQLIAMEMSTSKISKNKKMIPLLRQQRDDIIEKMLRNKTLKVKLESKAVPSQNLQNQLEENEVIIDFLLIQEGAKKMYCAIVIRESGTPLLIQLTDESAITSILNNDTYINEVEIRETLHKELWQPLEAHLENVTTVYLSPSGALHKIPFEALQNEKGEFLSERFQFHYYSSMRDFTKVQPQELSYKNAVLMGHILYDLNDSIDYKDEIGMRTDLRDKVEPLEATLEEVNRIDAICQQANLQTTLLTIDEPTEEVVQSFTDDKSPSIYHFATHGVFLNPTDTLGIESPVRRHLRLSADPLKRSALMLYGANHTWVKGEKILDSKEDGILTALEVTALDLQNTDLVVLSACSTGLGDVHNTEGVFGLQRAFKLAGVNYVVASLWDVDDDATKNLMVKFYENLLKEKQDPATALRNAKNYYRDKGYEPQDWAGFILIE